MAQRATESLFTSPRFTKRAGLLDDGLRKFVAAADLLVQERTDIETALKELGQRIPAVQRAIYKARLSEIPKQLERRRRIAEIVASGYDPYTIPPTFMVGFVEPPTAANLTRLGKRTAYVFNASIPHMQLRKYLEAKDSGLFDQIVVASSDQALFRRVSVKGPPYGSYVDPFIVGFVSLSEVYGRDFTFGVMGSDVVGGAGFLIAHWGLADEIPAV